MDERPVVGGERSCRRQDSLGAGNIQCVEHGDDCHPDRTCRAGGGADVLGPFRDYAPRYHQNRSQPGRAHQRPRHHFGSRFSLNGFQRHGGSRSGSSRTARPRWHGAGDVGECRRPAGVGQESGIETLDARIATVENRLITGNRIIRVIAGAADAIVVDPLTDPVYTYSSGRVLVDPLGHFTFSEGFAGAFSDDTAAGRTAQTEIIFQASSLPRNTQLRFPARIRSQTGATLTTVGEEDVTLVSGAARNQVVYKFSSGASSRSAVDAFSFSPVLERTGPVGTGTGFYQVTIGPIGAAEPTRRLPSTAVPRYEALLLPKLPKLPASKTFLFPVERGIDTQSFTVSNTADGGAQLTLRAFDDTGDLLEGPDVANERNRLLEARQTLTFDLEAMFGPGATAATVASVAIKSGNDRPVATTIGTTPGGAYALRSQAPVEPAYFPFDRRDPAEMPLVSVAGAGAADFESRWTLMDTAGVEQASAVREAGTGGAVRDSLDTLFVLMPRRCRWRATSGWNRWRLNSGEVSSTIPARGQPPCRRCSPWVPVGWCSPISSSAGDTTPSSR